MLSTWLQPLAIVALLANAMRASPPSRSLNLYDWGVNGLWPQITFKSSPLDGPRLNFLKWEKSCTDGFYLITPRGSYVPYQSPIILDGSGELVWKPTAQVGNVQAVTDLKVQTYQNQNVLTFWAGVEGEHHRYGMGSYYILDETYQVIKTVEAVKTRGHDLQGDIHEFYITPQNTALMTVYYPQTADLSSLDGPKNGWVLDSIFQEVDLDTNELIFEWRASDHVPIHSTMRSTLDSDNGRTPSSGFDYFHINSIDKDHEGNYIISARHTHQILCISTQGETLWILGGKNNMFTDLSSGHATNFSWQHHARWHGNNTLTLFDNAKSTTGGNPYRGDHSRGLLLRLNIDAKTAQVIHDYYDPTHPKLAESQGSMQMMEDTGHVFVDYGFLPAWTEFSPTGDVLCDVHLAPWIIWQLGMVTSYRVFKTIRWIGRPKYAPETYLRPAERVLYVSWNGATEVQKWVLQGSDWKGIHEDLFEEVAFQIKERFETAFDIADGMPQYLRVAAVDRSGEVLGYSQVVDRYVGNAGGSGMIRVSLVIVCVVLGLAVVLFLSSRRAKRVLFRICFSRGVIMTEVISRMKKSFLGWTGVFRHGAPRTTEYQELQPCEE